MKVEGKLFRSTREKNDKIIYENIRKIATDQGDDHTTGYLLDHPHFKDNYQMIVIDLSKLKVLDDGLEQFNKVFYRKFRSWWKYKKVFYSWRNKETILDFLQGSIRVL